MNVRLNSAFKLSPNLRGTQFWLFGHVPDWNEWDVCFWASWRHFHYIQVCWGGAGLRPFRIRFALLWSNCRCTIRQCRGNNSMHCEQNDRWAVLSQTSLFFFVCTVAVNQGICSTDNYSLCALVYFTLTLMPAWSAFSVVCFMRLMLRSSHHLSLQVCACKIHQKGKVHQKCSFVFFSEVMFSKPSWQ